jgi:hypothetical protein
MSGWVAGRRVYITPERKTAAKTQRSTETRHQILCQAFGGTVWGEFVRHQVGRTRHMAQAAVRSHLTVAAPRSHRLTSARDRGPQLRSRAQRVSSPTVTKVTHTRDAASGRPAAAGSGHGRRRGRTARGGSTPVHRRRSAVASYGSQPSSSQSARWTASAAPGCTRTSLGRDWLARSTWGCLAPRHCAPRPAPREAEPAHPWFE